MAITNVATPINNAKVGMLICIQVDRSFMEPLISSIRVSIFSTLFPNLVSDPVDLVSQLVNLVSQFIDLGLIEIVGDILVPFLAMFLMLIEKFLDFLCCNFLHHSFLLYPSKFTDFTRYLAAPFEEGRFPGTCLKKS